LRTAALCLIVSLGAQAGEEARPTLKALEIDVSAAYSFLVSSRSSNGVAQSKRNGGPGAAVAVLLHTTYFLSPFLDLSFHPLYASTDVYDLDPALGGPTALRSSLLALGVTGGAAFDYSRFRLRAGIGMTDVMVRSRSGAMRTSEWDINYFLSAAGFVWKSGRLKVGIELRAGIINDAETNFVAIGLVGGGDAVRWAGSD
jgi:hypothetical protein